MEIVSKLLSSNLVQIIVTFCGGALGYLVLLFLPNLRVIGSNSKGGDWVCAGENNRFPVWILKFSVSFVAASLLISFIFNLGEVYQYSYWYKRTFFVFGDGFPFVLILPLIIFARHGSWRFLSITFLSLFLLGGRMVLAASMIAMVVVAVESKMRRHFLVKVLKSIELALFVYFVALIFSNFLQEEGGENRFQSNFNPLTSKIEKYFDINININNVRGRGNSSSFEKLYNTQIHSPLRQRIFSTIGGAWMTFQGGFRGAAYPSTPEKFADLMIASNPYGINEKYSITWNEWQRMRAVQHPYFNFGSGYGWVGMGILLLFFCCLCLVGITNISSGRDSGLWSSLTIYFIFTVIINQTQPWIQSGSILLFLLGLCAAHILMVFSQRHRMAK
jgi:hypothetical protein